MGSKSPGLFSIRWGPNPRAWYQFDGVQIIETVINALKGGKVTVILDPKVLSKEIAEELAKAPTEGQIKRAEAGEIVESYGLAMAMSLRDAGVILPYSRAQIFTLGWEAKFQAHHILEVNMFGKLWKGEVTNNGPAVILSKAEHDIITGKLAAARKTLMDTVKKRGKDEMPTKDDVWAMYQQVYKDEPNWLQAIEQYF